jgi:hypothetical protein
VPILLLRKELLRKDERLKQELKRILGVLLCFAVSGFESET